MWLDMWINISDVPGATYLSTNLILGSCEEQTETLIVIYLKSACGVHGAFMSVHGRINSFNKFVNKVSVYFLGLPTANSHLTITI